MPTETIRIFNRSSEASTTFDYVTSAIDHTPSTYTSATEITIPIPIEYLPIDQDNDIYSVAVMNSSGISSTSTLTLKPYAAPPVNTELLNQSSLIYTSTNEINIQTLTGEGGVIPGSYVIRITNSTKDSDGYALYTDIPIIVEEGSVLPDGDDNKDVTPLEYNLEYDQSTRQYYFTVIPESVNPGIYNLRIHNSSGIGTGDTALNVLDSINRPSETNAIIISPVTYNNGESDETGIDNFLPVSSSYGTNDFTVNIPIDTEIGEYSLFVSNLAGRSDGIYLDVNDANQPATNIELSNYYIYENNSVGSLVGIISSTGDPDPTSYTYTLLAGFDKFEIINGNELVTKISFDKENPSHCSNWDNTVSWTQITIQSSEVNTENVITKDIWIWIRNIGWQADNYFRTEGYPAGSVFCNLVDPSGVINENYTYELLTGTEFFEIRNGHELVNIVDLNAEDFNYFNDDLYYWSVTIRATLTGEGYDDETQWFWINNIDEPFTDVEYTYPPQDNILDPWVKMDELVYNGAQIGIMVPAGDPDAYPVLGYSYELISQEHNTFALNTLNGIVTVNNNEFIDADPLGYYSENITVRLTDNSLNESITKTLTITFTEAAEAPSNIILSETTVDESLPIGSIIGTFTTIDEDVGNVFSYTLVAGDGDTHNSMFVINGDALVTATEFDYAITPSLSIRVNSTGNDGLGSNKILTLTVTDMNENAPSQVLINKNNVNEGLPIGSLVGTLSTVDADQGDTHTYTLVSGVGDTHNALFTISGDSLLTNAVFDYELRTFMRIRVRSTDSGGLYKENKLIIFINNVNDAPVDILLSNNTIIETTTQGSLIGTFTTSDPNYWDTYVYTFDTGSGDDDNASFTITDDKLYTNIEFNYEVKSSYSILVKTTDPSSNSYTKQFTILISPADETPVTGISLSNSTVTEGSANGVVVGYFIVSDIDVSEIYDINLTDSADGRFDIENPSDTFDAALVNTNTNAITMRNDVNRFSIGDTVVITGNDLLPTGLNLNTYYQIHDIIGDSVILYKNNNTEEVIISEVGEGIFYVTNLSVTNLIIKDTTRINYETDTSHDISVELTNADDSVYTQTFTITVLDASGLSSVISTVSPLASKIDTYPEITITGRHFTEGGDPTVRIDGEVMELTSFTDTTIIFTLINNIESGVHTLTVVNGAGL